MTDQYSDRQPDLDSIPARYLTPGDRNMNIESGNANEMIDENNDENNEEFEYENEDGGSAGKKANSQSFDKKKRKFKPSGTSGSPYTSILLNQSGQPIKNASQQQQQQINRSNKRGDKPGTHQGRYQVFHYRTQSNEEQEFEDENDENLENEDENEIDQDESYPLSPQQQAQYNRMQQQQHKMSNGKKEKSDGHLSKMNTVNSNNSMSNLNQNPPITRTSGYNMQPQNSLKMNPNKTNSLNMNNGHPGYPEENKSKNIDLWSHLLVGISYFFLIFSFPFSLCACVKVAQEYERAVIFRLGRTLTGGAKGPGIFFVLPCIDTYTKVDLRTVTFDVPPQEILTKDSVTVSVDAVVYFRIFNAVISVINVEDAAKSTKLLAASTLRNILGTKSLHEILSDRESVAILIQNNLDDATGPCKDVRLPVQLQRAMATEAEAAREARAKVIAAEGEQKASKALKEAAEVISESPIAIQLRYLQTLTQIASEKNSTIVFPIPLEMLSFLANKSIGATKPKTLSHQT